MPKGKRTRTATKGKRTNALPATTKGAPPPLFAMLQRVIAHPCNVGRYMLVVSADDARRSFRQLALYVQENKALLDYSGAEITFNITDHVVEVCKGRFGQGEQDFEEIRVMKVVEKQKNAGQQGGVTSLLL